MTFSLPTEVSKATQSRMEDHLKSCQLSKELKEKGIHIYTHKSGYFWVAVDDNTYQYRGDPMGTGQTEVEAIEDLVEQLEDK